MIVIKNTPDDIAGSNFNLCNKIGINAPKKPPTIIVVIIARARTKLK